MNRRLVLQAAALPPALLVLDAHAEDLREAMETDNARWLAAYNSNTPAAFPAMYANDAVVLPPGAPAVSGREAIGRFWEERLKPGNRKNHTFQIVGLQQDDHLAWQYARWTVDILKDGGEVQTLAGNTVRIFERQAGGWLTKVHIFTLTQ